LKYSIIKNNTVIDIIECDVDFAADYSAKHNVDVISDSTALKGYVKSNGVFMPPEPSLSEIRREKIKALKQEYQAEVEANDPLTTKLKDKISVINLSETKEELEQIKWLD